MDLNKPELNAIADIKSFEDNSEPLLTLDQCTLMIVGGGVGEVIFN